MISTVASNIPLYVWAILLALIGLGWVQSRTRSVSRAMILALPLAMVPLSLYSSVSSFGLSIIPICAWISGVVIAKFVSPGVFGSQMISLYSPSSAKYEVEGSWKPLVIMLIIFSARFIVGLASALNPGITQTSGFSGGISMVLGVCSGLFLWRAQGILAAKREAGTLTSDRPLSST